MLENHDATVSSPSVTFPIPSVARIKRYVPMHKKGVKFSRENVLSRDHYRCHYCAGYFSRKHLTYDHVVPRSQGGKTVWTNIVASCRACNTQKGARTPEQAGMRLLKKPERPKWLPLQMPSVPLKTVPETWGFYLQGVPHLRYAFG